MSLVEKIKTTKISLIQFVIWFHILHLGLNTIYPPNYSLDKLNQATIEYQNPQIKPLKKGIASKKIYLGSISLGDDSLNQALKDGGISKIHKIETGVFGNPLEAQFKTTVYGE